MVSFSPDALLIAGAILVCTIALAWIWVSQNRKNRSHN